MKLVRWAVIFVKMCVRSSTEIPSKYLTIAFDALRQTATNAAKVSALFQSEVPLVQQVCQDFINQNGTHNGELCNKIRKI